MNKELLVAYIKTFMGLGNINAENVLIGFEPGGKGEHGRITLWDKLGRLETYESMPWFLTNARNLPNKTSSEIEYIESDWHYWYVCCLENHTGWDARVCQIFFDEFDMYNQRILKLELFPLSNSTRKEWRYDEYFTREEYEDQYEELRIGKIQQMIGHNKAIVLVFKDEHYLTQISRFQYANWTQVPIGRWRLSYCENNGNIYLSVNQPRTHWTAKEKNQYYYRAREIINDWRNRRNIH